MNAVGFSRLRKLGAIGLCFLGSWPGHMRFGLLMRWLTA
jgi:hypothetical protein